MSIFLNTRHMLEQYATTLCSARDQATAVFESQLQEKFPAATKGFARKPSWGFRLWNKAGDLKVVLTPGWDKYAKRLIPSAIDVEVYGLIPSYRHKGTKKLATFAVEEVPRLTICRMYRDVEPVIQESLDLLTQWVADPHAVFRNCDTNCAVCGRVLTDGHSRAQGIGPECVRIVESLGCVHPFG